MNVPRSNATTGLVLTGGGARAAYQVGVLKAIARIRREVGAPRQNPFGVITGTSAGAVNAAAIACHADRFDLAVAGVVSIWRHFSADQVYRADAFGVVRTGARWLTMLTVGWAIARWRRARPRSLLDNSPLAELLQRVVHLDRLPELLAGGHLSALAITGSSYSSGDHVTFCQTAAPFEPWLRSQRVAVPSRIGMQHLMASSAIPFVFPAVQLEMAGRGEWFGDGSMRQSAPISPAVHLGAERILVIGAGRLNEPAGRHVVANGYPSLAQIAGHALSNIFLDALAVDVERAQRINRTLALLDAKSRAHTPLKPLDVLVIAPSQRLDDIAARHLHSLPPAVRTMLRAVGVGGEGREARGGAALASYLLFEAPYTRELIELGGADTLARRDEVIAFFGWPSRIVPREQRDAWSTTQAGGLECPTDLMPL
jgi:NTE family protein